MYLFSTLNVGRDIKSWKQLEHYLFSKMLIYIKKEKITTPQLKKGPLGPVRSQANGAWRAQILIEKLLGLRESSDGNRRPNLVILSLPSPEMPYFYISLDNQARLQHWQVALLHTEDSLMRELFSKRSVENRGLKLFKR